MKHIFIINPAAGPRSCRSFIEDALKKIKNKIQYELYETKCACDATRFVREYCKKCKDAIRFYACGGDGTLNEVANGIVGFPNAEVACIPTGSGNDFIKYYGTKEDFMNIEDNINGEAKEIDILQLGDKYSINVVNFGFDSIAADMMQKVKRKKLIGGKNAYTTGVVKALFKGMRNKCTVMTDGNLLHKGKMLLCTLANGKFIGGAYKCGPRAVNDDGLIEITLVKTMSIFTFVKLIGRYKNGSHLDDPSFDKYITYCRGKDIECVSPQKKFSVCLDGEVIDTNNFKVKIIHNAIRFVVPKALIQSPEPAMV